MNNFLGQFNLTTQERRVVVVIILVVFFVVNLLLVWPHFKDWNRITKQLEDMRRTEDTYNRDIQLDLNATNGWRKEVDKLARQEGGSKIDNPVDPQNQLQQTIIQQERKTGVTVGSFSPGPVKTNAFFEEHSTAITFESQEPQLVSFLYNMGNDPAMIRVVLPTHLRTLAHAGREVELEIVGPPTQRSLIDALEARYPALRGTIRNPATHRRRPFVRFFACENDLSHESPDQPRPNAVAGGTEPFFIVGAMAGG